MKRILYQELASAIQARKNCAASNNTEWFDKHEEKIESLVSAHMPHGSGFDNGTTIDLEASHADKLVFHTAFHHMDENGMYDGWTEHTVTITPSLQSGFNIRISGRDRNDIKEMMYQDFDYVLRRDVTYDLYLEHCPDWKIETKWIDQSTYRQCVRGVEFASLDEAREYAGQKMYAEFICPEK